MITKIEKYSASWCGPCHVLDKNLKELNTDIPITVFDADKNEDAFANKGIKNVPVLIFYNGTKELERTIGLKSVSDLKKIIAKYND